MISLKIDNQIVQAEEGTYLHIAARDAGISIPVMCWYEGMEHFSSCMVCLVKDNETGRFIPSCSVKVHDGMDITASSADVNEARKTALELLLSEHVGDCEAPCTLSCPAGMNIPLMNRLLAEGNFSEALRVVREDIALPSVLGRICPAPCEGACRRKAIDGAVSICLLKRFAGDENLNGNTEFQAIMEPSSGRKVAIAGAGPAGLSAAYYLQKKGYSCDVYEAEAAAGGAIRGLTMKNQDPSEQADESRANISEEKLPREILDEEISIIQSMGVNFIFNQRVDPKLFNQLKDEYSAVVIACSLDEKIIKECGLDFSGSGIEVNKDSFQTKIENVFAVGSAIRPSKLAIRSLAQGKDVLESIDQLLNGKEVTGKTKSFNSRFGKLMAEEYDEYLKESGALPRIEPAGGSIKGFSREEIVLEAARCLRCDCRKKDNCLLRDYSGDLNANQRRFASEDRKRIIKSIQPGEVVYEPAKCIKCGRCVRITAREKDKFGFTFIGRGFDVVIGVPFNESLKAALKSTLEEVILACPTGALAGHG
jgi:hypothetical protein